MQGNFFQNSLGQRTRPAGIIPDIKNSELFGLQILCTIS